MKTILMSLMLGGLASGVWAADPAKSANETELPPPPAGFHWERFTEIKGAALCPEGWFRKHAQTPDAHTFSLSKESVAEKGSFETGYTIQAIKGLKRKKKLAPFEVALMMGETIEKDPVNRKLKMWDASNGPFKSFGIRYRNAPANMKPIVIHKLFIANDQRDTLFVVTFEAPEASWDEAWIQGEKMMKMILIDDEY